jgi:hypothetical protein
VLSAPLGSYGNQLCGEVCTPFQKAYNGVKFPGDKKTLKELSDPEY